MEAATANPALRLIDMFRPFKWGPADLEVAREAMGIPRFETDKAVSYAKSLSRHNLAPLGRADALRWLGYWQKAGLLKTKEFAPVPEERELSPAMQAVAEVATKIAVPTLAILIFGIAINLTRYIRPRRL